MTVLKKSRAEIADFIKRLVSIVLGLWTINLKSGVMVTLGVRIIRSAGTYSNAIAPMK